MLQEIEAEHTEFQSTLLMRGATSLILHKDTVTLISIHAPHARSDDKTHKMIHDAYRFQSTLLMRGATVNKPICLRSIVISIHAPHARSDKCPLPSPAHSSYFNPRSSCEERRVKSIERQDNR